MRKFKEPPPFDNKPEKETVPWLGCLLAPIGFLIFWYVVMKITGFGVSDLLGKIGQILFSIGEIGLYFIILTVLIAVIYAIIKKFTGRT